MDNDESIFVSGPPSRFDSDREEVKAALAEIRHFERRQDVPPQFSTLDGNIQRAIEHLENILNGNNSEP